MKFSREVLQVIVHDPEQAQSSFQQLASGRKRKYVMISGKGGVGKTSLASSLACQLAAGICFNLSINFGKTPETGMIVFK